MHNDIIYRFCYLPLNGIIVIVELLDLDLNLHGQTFSCEAVVVKKCAGCGFARQICLESHDPPWSWSFLYPCLSLH